MHTATALPVPSAAAEINPFAELAVTLLGPSPAMAKLWSHIRRLAPHMRTLLLTGAPACGQEAVARLLLDLSAQPRRVFIKIAAAEAGDRLVRAQALGTLPPEGFLFLPDVDSFSMEAQQALLRLLRNRRSQGYSVVAAAGDNLRTLVATGRFLPELAEALSSVIIKLPALTERPEDVPMLLQQMLAVRCQAAQRPLLRLGDAVITAASRHTWPENLFELSEVVDALLAGTKREAELDLADWNRALSTRRAPKPQASVIQLKRLDLVIQEHVFGVLEACGGNKQRAAEVLGISRSTLYRALEGSADRPAELSVAQGRTALPLAC